MDATEALIIGGLMAIGAVLYSRSSPINANQLSKAGVNHDIIQKDASLLAHGCMKGDGLACSKYYKKYDEKQFPGSRF